MRFKWKPVTPEEIARYGWVRTIGAVLLLVGAAAILIFIAPATWRNLFDENRDMALPSAYVTYIVLMVQAAFILARKYKSKAARLIKSLSCAGSLILAAAALWLAVFPNEKWEIWTSKLAFGALIISSVATITNTIFEGRQQSAVEQTVAWIWKPAPWESTAPSGSESAA